MTASNGILRKEWTMPVEKMEKEYCDRIDANYVELKKVM